MKIATSSNGITNDLKKPIAFQLEEMLVSS
jgi:hypothetical protein